MKVAIIGAGISGLSAGCYLQMNGFETEIFESNSRPGGLCTSWKKGGYTFNSSPQWLMGSGESNEFFKLWSELIDVHSIRFHYADTRLEIETLKHRDRHGSNIFRLYTNLDRLEKYLMDIAPEDGPEIRNFIRQIRKIQRLSIPPRIRELPQLLPWYRKIGYARYLPMLFFLRKYSKITTHSFAAKLKNDFLKEAFRLLFDGEDLSLMIHTFPLAYFDNKSAGYPLGGGSALTDKIEQKYHSLGGILHFNSPVEKILVENNSATGLKLENGSEVPADIVISAADWHFSVFRALEGKYVNKKILDLGKMKTLEVFPSVLFIFLGLNRSFPDLSGLLRFPLEVTLLSPDGSEYHRLELHLHNYDPALAPAGKTVVSVCLYTRKGDFWINLRESDKKLYDKTRDDLAREVIDILEKKFGGIKENLEQTSVATPATFHRYTNNWQGSIQGWLPGKNMISPSPVNTELPGLRNFYLAGHWTMPGGGLPIAVKSAREAAMMICHKAGKKFVTGQ